MALARLAFGVALQGLSEWHQVPSVGQPVVRKFWGRAVGPSPRLLGHAACCELPSSPVRRPRTQGLSGVCPAPVLEEGRVATQTDSL